MARKMLRRERREQLRERSVRMLERDFVEDRLVPLLASETAVEVAPFANWTAETVWARGTGRMTFRYCFDDDTILFAKAYTDSLGARSHNFQQHFWRNGYDRRAALRVPEPLAFFAQENVLVMRSADGVPMDKIIVERSIEEIAQAARLAARWLASLHTSDVPLAEIEQPCEMIKIFKLADGLAKAAAAYPEQTALLLNLLAKIRRIAPAATTPLVPTHGQYTPANVFVGDEAVTVIDLDRILLSDPAKDVALFTHRVKSYLLRASGDMARAEAITRFFTDEYERHAPAENLVNLPYYKALFLIKGFAKFAKDRPPDDPARKTPEEFYLAEFERAISEASLRGATAEGVASAQ